MRARTVESRIMSADAVARLSRGEVLDLIFLDTLTTTLQVDQFSGRGIGLAVVRAETEKLGGSVTVNSVPGQGSAFTFFLPFEEGARGIAFENAIPRITPRGGTSIQIISIFLMIYQKIM